MIINIKKTIVEICFLKKYFKLKFIKEKNPRIFYILCLGGRIIPTMIENGKR